jgi:hypothetical protein
MPAPDTDDWTARHARTRPETPERRVVLTDVEDDWSRRHAECRR